MRKHKCSIFPEDQCDGSCFVPDPDPGLNWPNKTENKVKTRGEIFPPQRRSKNHARNELDRREETVADTATNQTRQTTPGTSSTKN